MAIANLSEEVGKIIYEQLPQIIRNQPEVRFVIWDMLSEKFASKDKTEDRFEKLLEEIKALEEKSDRKFEQVFKKLEENDRKFEKIFKKLEENDRKFEEHSRKFEEHSRKFEEQNRKFDEKFEKMLNEIRNVDKRIDRAIRAIGARWGLSIEDAFRQGIKSVLEEFTNTKVEHYLGLDNEGVIFGWPEQVEIDVVVKNGKLCLMEIKFSTSKSDVYIFDRKVAFYEKETGRKPDKKIIVSLIFGPGAQEFARKLNIETYTEPEDIP